MKGITYLVSEGFIQGVGITRPRPGKEKRAAFYITGALAATVVGIVSMFFLLLHQVH